VRVETHRTAEVPEPACPYRSQRVVRVFQELDTRLPIVRRIVLVEAGDGDGLRPCTTDPLK
jgi:hypothetical protein